ncbi:MAG: PQQ-binding-like beta-propeller repeat protein [Candidatus Bathyarchaeia archaeon]
MKTQNNRTPYDRKKLVLIATMILSSTMLVSLVALPTATAHTPALNIPTWAYLTVEPNPVGVGQAAYVNFWLDKAPPTANAQYGDRWEGFKVTVTKPDGTKEDMPLGAHATSDAVGGSYATFTPTQVGTYTFVFSYPGQTIAGKNPPPSGTSNSAFVGDYFQPSTSVPVTLTVQQEQIKYFPSIPLPKGYWTRPIQSENLDWYTIGGNWLGLWQQGNGGSSYNASGNFQPYTTGPNSAHIMWTKPLAPGGIIGGEFGGNEYGSSYYQTPQYECKFRGIIINGVLYYRSVPGSVTDAMHWIALDLRTGKEIWTLNTTASMLCGQTLSYTSPNQFGALAYLWSTETTVAPNTGSTYGLYDAMTGDWILNIVNASSLRLVEADDGTLLGYYVNNTDRTLCMWNSTRCILVGQAPQYYGVSTAESWMWRPPLGKSIPFYYGIQWKAPLATSISGAAIDPLLSISTLSSDVVLMTSIPSIVGGYSWQPGWKIIAGYSAKNGQLLWGPFNKTETPWARVTMSPAMNGMWVEFTHETMTWSAFNLYTGQKMWGPTDPYPNAWGYYVAYPPIIAYGKLFACDFAGYLHAYDTATGKRLWSFFTGESGYETPYGNYPLLHIEFVADGKVYVMGGHTYSPPLFRGSKFWCINATTGEPIWNVANFVSANQATGVIADGYIVNENGYDNQIYCYGKGLSATTVTASPKIINSGSAVLIEGTVTDQSPGMTALGIPAAGTPAISDASMTAWMEYLYMQKPKPTNATGVPVKLTALDPNGNTQDIGTVSSDAAGMFKKMWTPPVPGEYTIIATFAGSESYYDSSAETAIGVSVAPPAPVVTSAPAPTTPQETAAPSPTPTPAGPVSPSPTSAPQPEAPPPTDMYVIAGVAAVVVIVVAAAAVILRRRK